MRLNTGTLASALLALAMAGPSLAQDDAKSEGARDPIPDALERIEVKRLESDLRRLVEFGTRHTLSKPEENRGAHAASAWIHQRLGEAAKASGGRMTVEFDEFDPRRFSRPDRPAIQKFGIKRVRNVIAKLEGSEPHRVIIVSGHYDSRVTERFDISSDAPGANDDGSGTVVTMELARVLAPMKTRASIWFACVTGEELGLWGSTHMAQQCDEKGIGVEAMITNDIVGGSKDDEGKSEDDVLRIFSEGRPVPRQSDHQRRRRLARWPSESDSPSREFARHMARSMRRYTPEFKPRLIFRLDRYLRGGDHRPFTQLGYAAIRLTEPKENYRFQHQDVRVEDGKSYGDLPELVDFAYIGRVTRANAAAILALAMAPEPVKGAALVSTLENGTRLRWDESDDESIVGYRVLYRRTHEPEWTGHRDVGRVNAVKMSQSKDDFLFAIQALDAQGNASLPSFTLPSRRRR